MKHTIVILLFLTCLQTTGETIHTAKHLLSQSNQWAEAEAVLSSLLANATNGQVNINAAELSLGHAQAKQGKWEQALESLNRIVAGDAPELTATRDQQKGQIHYHRAMRHRDAQNLKDALADNKAAIESFEKVLRNRSSSASAKNNLELALRQQRELKHLQEQQQQNQEDDQNQEGDPQETQPENENQEPQNPESGQEPNQSDSSEQEENQQPEQEQENNSQQEPADQDSPETTPPEQPSPGEEPPGNQQEEQEESRARQAVEPSGISREQAEAELDALLQSENRQRRLRKEQLRTRAIPVEKDW